MNFCFAQALGSLPQLLQILNITETNNRRERTELAFLPKLCSGEPLNDCLGRVWVKTMCSLLQYSHAVVYGLW